MQTEGKEDGMDKQDRPKLRNALPKSGEAALSFAT